uniref:Protein PatA n=2 Tax=Gloeothece TaxID=28070 RepID=E0UEC9_GLOV7|nr:response regulator receiver protein [Gloeothece verrucosa PCC 7822]
MQGTLNEIDIRSILQLIELGQRTGELFVEAYPSTGNFALNKFSCSPWPKTLVPYTRGVSEQFWFVFFVNGQIAYAADHSQSNLFRLRDYLHRYKIADQLNHLPLDSIESTNTPEYGCIWLLLAKNILTPAQGRSIIENMIQETLFDLFSLHHGSFIFEMGSAIAPQLTTLEIGIQIPKIIKQVQQWKQFYPQIQHPDQYVLLTDEESLKSTVPEKIYLNLSQWAEEKTTLRQLSRYLNRELVAIARALYPYTERGWLQLVSPLDPRFTKVDKALENQLFFPKIVCIDDDITIRKNVENILQENGYQVTIIGEPLQALSQVFEIEPDLILCDIAMPKLDGYELCAMLRQSTVFRQIPIIMLTGQETFIDRVRARMVGATDYLTKPFGRSELLLLLEKYTGCRE